MIRRILVAWVVANFLIVGLISLAFGRWYILWDTNPVVGMLIELGVLMIPNFALAILALRFWWPEPVESLRKAFGWQWQGWRSFLAGLLGFGLFCIVMIPINLFLGRSIPYNLPDSGPIQTDNLLQAIGLLLLLVVFVAVTVAAEETMFRGLMQTQLAQRYGFWIGLLVPALLFGLRHLPNDIFYAHLWQATPQMWLARLIQLYCTALLLGLVRHVGKSTYASGILHTLILLSALFG